MGRIFAVDVPLGVAEGFVDRSVGGPGQQPRDYSRVDPRCVGKRIN